MTKTAKARFFEKVALPNATGCTLWLGGLAPHGYGIFWFAGKSVSAHKFSYHLLVGPVPAGLHLDHLCRVRHCVAPGHLEPVTVRTNLLRGAGLAAINAAKTHCSRGHAYTEGNTYYYASGRQCKTCVALRRKETR